MAKRTRGSGLKADLDFPPGSTDYSVEDVCRLQLEAAVNEYTFHLNAVAAHLLASASHDVMRGHAKRSNLTLRIDVHTKLRASFGDDAVPMIDALKGPYNSLKHANGSDVAVTLHHSFAELICLQAVQEFGSLFGYVSPKMLFFALWVNVVNEQLRKAQSEKICSMFPAAMKSGKRKTQIADLRRWIKSVDRKPNPYPGDLAKLSTDLIWKAAERNSRP